MARNAAVAVLVLTATCIQAHGLRAAAQARTTPRDGGAAADSSSSADPAELLSLCYNRHYDPAPASFQGWLDGRPASLYLADVWWSPRAEGDGGSGRDSRTREPLVTLFTMASMDRLGMVEAQCRGYAGPLSAAIHLPLLAHAGDSSEAAAVATAAAAGQWQYEQDPYVEEYIELDREAGDVQKERKRKGLQDLARGRGHEATAPVLDGGSSNGTTNDRSGDRSSGAQKGGSGRASGSAMSLPEFRARLSAANRELLDSTRSRLQALFDSMESAATAAATAAVAASAAATPGSAAASSRQRGPCALRLLLFVELVADPQLGGVMPTNALRNAAGLAARTPLAAMLDADLGVSAGLGRLAADPAWLAKVTELADGDSPSLCILPAWEATTSTTTSTSKASPGAKAVGAGGPAGPEAELQAVEATITGSKAEVVRLWRSGRLQVFHEDGCKRCHGPIDHKRWALAAEPYDVKWAQAFEPWGILARHRDPGYDERFRGWCYDKIQHVESLARLTRLGFTVLPDAWLVHRPHRRTSIATLSHGGGGSSSSSKGSSKHLNKAGGGKQPQPQHRTSSHEAATQDEVSPLLQVLPTPDGRNATAYQLYRAYVNRLIRAERKMLGASQEVKEGMCVGLGGSASFG
ncbi:hypothetical protein HYH02_007661 [Chlamydomonas schloesseri]|uniref:Uncharacterized protein n=1 Tax=Chlamydomonas schloesseri TaxID=2026947 RepID=A0A835WH63_9CHLO|nr:hypothetical protein HYH02_007661 [Chlamydomonas schloesseri]|eukprot:KAG2447332.1 hypothetical protein HYH02_007661 [Chlamydomonas schloesseri]